MDNDFKEKFNIRRKEKMLWFSRSKVEKYWFHGLLDMYVDLLKTNENGMPHTKFDEH